MDPQLRSTGLDQGWTTFLVGGPYLGKRSPCRAGLSDGSSSISSTTLIIRVALLEGQKRKGQHVLSGPVFH